MGKVLEPATPAALHVRSLTPLSSCNSRTQVTLVLPRSAGLKILSSRRPAAGISPHSPFFHRRGTPRGIVCEQRQQEVIVSVGAVNEATWKELVLDCDIPVLVDFWAPWCGPCRMIAPLVDELAKLYAGRVRCLKLNTDESPNKATEYGIRSIPTVLIFKKGEKKDAIVGAVPKATLVATVEKYLDK